MQIPLIALIIFPTLLFAQYENTPKVGEQAPALTLQQWLKGEPVAELKIGQLYVVEFSATWCVPCRKSIPHFTQLTKQYSDKFKFISVYIEDNNLDDYSDLSYIKKVQYLIDALGSKVGFSVAVDVPQQTCKKAWGINGIPAAFVINEFGKIAWIGHPMDLDNVLQEISAGTFDPKKAQQQQVYFQERARKIVAEKSVTGIDSLIKSNPNKNWLYKDKFDFLAKDSAKAYGLVRWLLKTHPENFDWLGLIAGFDKIPSDKRNYELELRTLDRCIEESETNVIASYPMFLKGEAYAALGDFSKAVEWGEKAIEAEKLPCEPKANSFYDLGLAVNRYQLLLKDNREKAASFLRAEVKNKQLRVDDKMIKAILKSSDPDYTLALELVSNTLEKEEKDIRYRGHLLGLKSRIYAAKKDFKEAIEWGQQAATEYSKEGGNPRLAKKQLAMIQEYKQKLEGG